MKKLLVAALGAVALVAALFVNFHETSAAGETSSYMHPKSSLRYHVMSGTYSGSTSSISGQVLSVVPPGKHVLRCVEFAQATVGTTPGTSTITFDPKINGTSLLTTNGVLSSTSLANKSIVNASCTMPGIDATNVATVGRTLPVIRTDGTATAKGGSIITFDATFGGSTYSGAPSGVVKLFWEPAF